MYNWDKQASVWTLTAPESVLGSFTPEYIRKIKNDSSADIFVSSETVVIKVDAINPRRAAKCLRKAHDMIMSQVHKQYTVLENMKLQNELKEKYVNDPRPASLVRASAMRKETAEKDKSKKANRRHRGIAAATGYLHNPGEGENVVKGFGKK